MTQETEKTTKKKPRRVFLWSFLAVQIVYIVWLVTGLVSAAGTSANTAAEAAGKDIGTTIGAALIIGLWIATDVILGIGRWVYLTARKHRA